MLKQALLLIIRCYQRFVSLYWGRIVDILPLVQYAYEAIFRYRCLQADFWRLNGCCAAIHGDPTATIQYRKQLWADKIN